MTSQNTIEHLADTNEDKCGQRYQTGNTKGNHEIIGSEPQNRGNRNCLGDDRFHEVWKTPKPTSN